MLALSTHCGGPTAIELRLAREEDANLLWIWANDPATRAASFSTEPISWPDHVAWFRKVLSDPQIVLYIVLGNDEPVGQIRFDPYEGETATVSFALAPEHRGKGLAAASLRTACSTYAAATGRPEIVAFIKSENARSLRAFTRAGFVTRRSVLVRGSEAVELRLAGGLA